MLAKPAKKGYTYPSGADLIRCVGGTSPAQVQGSANSLVLPLFHCFHTLIILSEQVFVNGFWVKNMENCRIICKKGMNEGRTSNKGPEEQNKVWLRS